MPKVPVFHARAEFRRRDRSARWVLAGVVIDGDLWPVDDDVRPIRGRLPESGLVGWADLSSPIIAGEVASAAAVAIEVARSSWPDADRREVPWASGTGDDVAPAGHT
jgi:hypothetical protein